MMEGFNSKAVIDHIVSWLRDYAERAGVNGFVVGVSGGIDSAVTSTLCALTGLPVTGVELPIHQAASQVSRAQEHLAHLAARHPHFTRERVDLTAVFDALTAAVPAHASEEVRFLALANARARLRMTALYTLAQERRALVAGTGNKVEDFGVGFYTKYGDGGVDLSPIADLVKTEVFALGAALGVPASIQQAAPTDGLWGDDRTDEDQIGATYPELEAAMAFTGDPATLTGRAAEVHAIYTRLHRANRHKMDPIPVCMIPASVRRTE